MSLLPEFIQPILGSPWAWVLLPIMFWFYINYKSLTSYKDHPESFQQAIALLREDKFGRFYRTLLGKVLDKVSGWLNDKKYFSPRYLYHQNGKPKLKAHNRFFSINPFSPQSYEFVLRLAFVYPILSFLLVWVLGGDARFLGYGLSKVVIEQRWLVLLLTFFVPIFFLLWILKRQILTQWLLLAILSALAIILGFSDDVIIIWVTFLSLFIPCYISGIVIAWWMYGNLIIAHQVTYRFTFIFSGATAGSAIGVIALIFYSSNINATAAIINSSNIIVNAVIGIFFVAFAVIGAVITTVSGVIAGSVVIATFIAFLSAFTFIGSFLSNTISSSNIAIFIAIFIIIFNSSVGVIFVFLDKLKKYSEHKKSKNLFWFFYTIFLFSIAFLIMLDSKNSASEVIGFLLFYLILPFVNVSLDWLSLGITRGLLHSIYHQHHSGLQAFAWALFDVALAIFFLFAVSALLVITVGIVDRISEQTILRTALDALSKPETAKDYYWVHAMLLTTLIPTLVHFAIAGTSLVMWLPQQGRRRMANNLKGNLYKLWAASFYLTFTPIIGLLAPIALLYGLYLLVTAHGGWLGGVLLDWANLLAGVIV